MINWPDGIFSKVYGKKIKKIPGREILNQINIPKKIKRIIIIGILVILKKYVIQNLKSLFLIINYIW